MKYVDLAFDYIQVFPQRVVLLGIQPSGPEIDYGWIEPGRPAVLGWSVFHNLQRVRGFYEKPPLPRAEELFQRGCLWNSLVLIGNTRKLLGLFARTLPEHYRSFSDVTATLGSSFEAQAMEFLYRNLSAADFSYCILQKVFSSLVVLPVTGVEWSDLGTPERVLAALRRSGIALNRDTARELQTSFGGPQLRTLLPDATEPLLMGSTQLNTDRQRRSHPQSRARRS